MKTADQVRTPRARTGTGHPTHAAGGHGRWRFLRHYLEMVAAMLVGMVVLGAAMGGVLALAGLQFPAQYPELVALEMAFTMSTGMVAWMRHRGHGWASTLEMAGAMFAPPWCWSRCCGWASSPATLCWSWNTWRCSRSCTWPCSAAVTNMEAPPVASTTPARRPWTGRLKDRWPTALALAMSAATFGGSESEEGVASLSEALLLLSLLYLVVASCGDARHHGRRSWS
jgi:hypothetical protein